MLSNRNAVIIGGLGGIGTFLSRALLQNNVKNLAIFDILPDATDEFKSNANVTYLQCNITDENALRDAFQKIWSEFSGFDLIINASGVLNEIQPEKAISVNTVSIFSISTDRI